MRGSLAAADPAPIPVGPSGDEEEAQTVIQIIQGIQDPTAPETALEAPVDYEELSEASKLENQEDTGSHYWDASTMAPLNAAAAVSTSSSRTIYARGLSNPSSCAPRPPLPD
jgi:hypothetical protein